VGLLSNNRKEILRYHLVYYLRNSISWYQGNDGERSGQPRTHSESERRTGKITGPTPLSVDRRTRSRPEKDQKGLIGGKEEKKR